MTTATNPSESTRGNIGQGLYSLAELRTYVALQADAEAAQHVPRWLSDVLLPVARTPREPDHSFSDLISLFVVRELRRHGVAPATIREAEGHLREVWGTDRPFVFDVIQTDGRDIFADGAQVTGQIEAASRSSFSKKRGQQVMLAVVKDLLRDVRYVDGRAGQWAPVQCVVLNPAVQFGEPVIEGTRVTTAAVAELAELRGVDIAADRLRVSAAQAQAALAFERRLAAARN